MQLKTYLTQRQIAVYDFCRTFDLPLQNVYRWLRGANIPHPIYMKKIMIATSGKVTPADWREMKENNKEKKDGKERMDNSKTSSGLPASEPTASLQADS